MEDSKTALSEMGGDRVDLEAVARLDLGSKLRFDRQLSEEPGTATYLAHEKRRRRPVQLRVVDRQLLKEAGTLHALEANVSEVAALEHRGIVPVYDFGIGQHVAWWTSQFVEAPTLTEIIRQDGAMPRGRILRIATSVAEALGYAHDRGVAHAGLTPESLLIRADDWAVVTDFVRPESWLPSDRPREIRSPSRDQRALAVTIYRCLIGDADRPTAVVLSELTSTTVLSTRRPDLSPAVVLALVRGAESDPHRQFRSLPDLVSALDAPAPPSSAPKSTTAAVPDFAILVPEPDPVLIERRRFGRRLIGIGALVVLGFAGVWFGLTRLLASPDNATIPGVVATDTTGSASAGPVQPPVAVAPSMSPASQSPPLPAATNSPPPSPPPARAKPAATKHAAPKRKAARAVPPKVVDRPADATAAPRADLTARLLVRPVPGGTLYVDDRLIGPAIETAIPVSAGRHVVRITRPGYRRYLSMVDVASGEERRLTDVVLQPEK